MIFTRSIMLVQPLPNNWDASKWTSMITSAGKNDKYLIFGFSDAEVGKDFFNTLCAWNDNKIVNEKNIQLSLIKEEKNNYSVHIYPMVEREFVTSTYNHFERKFDKKKMQEKSWKLWWYKYVLQGFSDIKKLCI